MLQVTCYTLTSARHQTKLFTLTRAASAPTQQTDKGHNEVTQGSRVMTQRSRVMLRHSQPCVVNVVHVSLAIKWWDLSNDLDSFYVTFFSFKHPLKSLHLFLDLNPYCLAVIASDSACRGDRIIKVAQIPRHRKYLINRLLCVPLKAFFSNITDHCLN